jgi:hypothetical protein
MEQRSRRALSLGEEPTGCCPNQPTMKGLQMPHLFSRRAASALALGGPLATLAARPSQAQLAEFAVPAMSDAQQIAIDAYIYGYSLITTEVTRVQMTNVAKAEGLKAPIGQFNNVRRYPPADYRGVSAPNADTLYSLIWLDVGAEPMVFSHPDMGSRYFLFPMYSLWMPVVASPGSRTTGEKAASYLITGPGWTGTVPDGMTRIESPTRYFLILGRTYANGTEEDFKAVNALQDQYEAVPLSAFGKPFSYKAPPVDADPGFSMTDKPQAVIEAMDLEAYFDMMARLMGSSAPPAPEDAPIIARMARIGLVPGRKFELGKLDQATQAALKNVPGIASARIFAQQSESGFEQNGWRVPAAAGAYGTDYLQRALIAAFGWPANLPEDAVYPYADQDGDGQKLSGEHKYTLTFAKGRTPPVDGFWSITMYIVDGGWWFYPNALNRFTVSMRDRPKLDADGSLTLYFQHESPGKELEANWLPAPAGEFLLTMRMYWPKATPPSILPPGAGSWRPPAIKRVG